MEDGGELRRATRVRTGATDEPETTPEKPEQVPAGQRRANESNQEPGRYAAWEYSVLYTEMQNAQTAHHGRWNTPLELAGATGAQPQSKVKSMPGASQESRVKKSQELEARDQRAEARATGPQPDVNRFASPNQEKMAWSCLRRRSMDSAVLWQPSID